jgi:DNA-directed RNA polymerase specialized sigma24 family protein
VVIPLTPRRRGRRGAAGKTRPAHAAGGRRTGQEIAAIYGTQYSSLVRLAVLLVGDLGTAEEVTQDSFVAMHDALRQLRDRDKALRYLRQSVVNRSRFALRHRMLAGPGTPGKPGAGQGAITPRECMPVISALRALPPRQREALVLRFYLDLPEEQVASAMRTSRGAVTRHTARAMAALSGVLKLAS